MRGLVWKWMMKRVLEKMPRRKSGSSLSTRLALERAPREKEKAVLLNVLEASSS